MKQRNYSLRCLNISVIIITQNNIQLLNQYYCNRSLYIHYIFSLILSWNVGTWTRYGDFSRHDGLEGSMSVDWNMRIRFKSQRGQLGFLNEDSLQNNDINIINTQFQLNNSNYPWSQQTHVMCVIFLVVGEFYDAVGALNIKQLEINACCKKCTIIYYECHRFF